MENLLCEVCNTNEVKLSKVCRKCYLIQYKIDNKEKIKQKSKEYKIVNKLSITEKSREYRINNKEVINLKNKIYYESNKLEILEKNSEYRINNLDKERSRKKKYYNENKEELITKNNIRRKLKCNNPKYRVILNIRSLLIKSFKNHGYVKDSKTANIIGCSFEDFKEYLESKFEYWMTWDNYGKYNGEFNYGWDMDHIIPISSAKTIDDVLKLNHYLNFQPLCSKVNRDIKKDKICTH